MDKNIQKHMIDILHTPLSHRELYWAVRRFLDGPIMRYMAASRPVKSVTVAL